MEQRVLYLEARDGEVLTEEMNAYLGNVLSSGGIVDSIEHFDIVVENGVWKAVMLVNLDMLGWNFTASDSEAAEMEGRLEYETAIGLKGKEH